MKNSEEKPEPRVRPLTPEELEGEVISDEEAERRMKEEEAEQS